MNKYISIGLASLLVLFLCAWTFNHINPWIGILASIGFVWALINYIIKLIKQQNQNEKEQL